MYLRASVPGNLDNDTRGVTSGWLIQRWLSSVAVFFGGTNFDGNNANGVTS